MFAGIIIFLLLATAGLVIEAQLIDRLRHSRANDWLADHIYLPLLRLPALIGFVLGSYPALYGLERAPPLAVLLDFDWFGRTLNALFVLPLAFSLLPVAGRLSGFVLPLQGIAVTALLFAPLAAAHGIDSPSFRSDGPALMALLVFGFGGHWLGQHLAAGMARRRIAEPTYDAVILVCQAPAIFAYGRALGAQL